MREYVTTLLNGRPLSRHAAHSVFSSIVAGDMSDIEITAVLVAMKMLGESPDAIAGAVEALRAQAREFPRPDYRIADIVGTGGDGVGTINISTAASFVCAAAGLPVAKHGNRSVSSLSGAADVMERFGAKLDATPELARRCLDETGVTFLFAPHYHSGIRHVMPVRQALATRTIFNILGPLLNPAQPQVMLVGVYQPDLCSTLAEALHLVGCERALVVHGLGLDEIALHGATRASVLIDGSIQERTFTPSDFGVKNFDLETLLGSGPDANAVAVQAVLQGTGHEAHATAVAVNAAATLYIGEIVQTLPEAFGLAWETIKSGEAWHRVEAMAKVCASP